MSLTQREYVQRLGKKLVKNLTTYTEDPFFLNLAKQRGWSRYEVGERYVRRVRLAKEAGARIKQIHANRLDNPFMEEGVWRCMVSDALERHATRGDVRHRVKGAKKVRVAKVTAPRARPAERIERMLQLSAKLQARVA